MKRTLILSALISGACIAQTDEDLELTFDDDMPVFMEPSKPQPKKLNTTLSDDNYCICKCLKKGANPKKAKAFVGRLKNKACVCECAV